MSWPVMPSVPRDAFTDENRPVWEPMPADEAFEAFLAGVRVAPILRERPKPSNRPLRLTDYAWIAPWRQHAMDRDLAQARRIAGRRRRGNR